MQIFRFFPSRLHYVNVLVIIIAIHTESNTCVYVFYVSAVCVLSLLNMC